MQPEVCRRLLRRGPGLLSRSFVPSTGISRCSDSIRQPAFGIHRTILAGIFKTTVSPKAGIFSYSRFRGRLCRGRRRSNEQLFSITTERRKVFRIGWSQISSRQFSALRRSRSNRAAINAQRHFAEATQQTGNEKGITNARPAVVRQINASPVLGQPTRTGTLA